MDDGSRARGRPLAAVRGARPERPCRRHDTVNWHKGVTEVLVVREIVLTHGHVGLLGRKAARDEEREHGE